MASNRAKVFKSLCKYTLTIINLIMIIIISSYLKQFPHNIICNIVKERNVQTSKHSFSALKPTYYS